MSSRALRIDPVTFEVLRNALVAAVDEMGLMLEKVAFSLVVSEGRDFSTSICDARGRLIADGTQDLPGHVGTIPFTTKAILELVGAERLHEGDVIIMNDPYLGGTHCQDVRTVMPVYWNDALVAFVQASAHWLDVGGVVPGSWVADAATAYEEALYITPLHLVRAGEVDEDVLRLILRNVRMADVTKGDIVAMVEACRTGDARLQALFQKYGHDVMLAEMSELLDHSRSLLKAHIGALPDGTYSFTDYVDFDPGAETREAVPIHLDMHIDGDAVTYDFSTSAPQARGGVNISRSLLWSGVIVATKAVFPEVPVNEGLFAAVDVIAPDGLIVTAQFPAATSAGFSSAYEKVTACVLACYLQVAPERSMVGAGNISNFVLGGVDFRAGGEAEFLMYDWTAGGYGARPGKRDNHSAISLFASGTRNQPLERMERAYPVVFEAYELMQDSGGAGRHRGGLGIRRRLRLVEGEGILSSTGDRELYPAWGYGGGKASTAGDGMVYETPDGQELAGTKLSGVTVTRGSTLHYWEGGGGGYGPPWERPEEWVLEDVANGYVSIDGAREEYYVDIRTIDADRLDYEIDRPKTAELRRRAGEAARRRSTQ
jgi:N-methylhydantoinase B